MQAELITNNHLHQDTSFAHQLYLTIESPVLAPSCKPSANMSFLLNPSRRIASSPSLSRAFSTTRPSQLARMTMVGRLGTDPEISESSKGNQVIKYVVGTSFGPKDNKQTSWFRVASFAPEGPQRDYIMGLGKG